MSGRIQLECKPLQVCQNPQPSVQTSVHNLFGGETFFFQEFIPYIDKNFRTIAAKEGRAIAGLSMGGYGAMKAALTYPDRFGGAASLSGTLDIADANRRRPMDEWRGIFGFDMENQGELKGTHHDLFTLAQDLYNEKKAFPGIYLWCGEQDGGHIYSERFSALLNEMAVPHLYESSAGDHSWGYWDIYIQNALRYLSEQLPIAARWSI